MAKNLEEKPPLSVVNLPSSTPKPPANLGPAGAGLWRSIMSEYDVSDAGGQAMLERLERRNLLMVPLDERRSWYRYHHLFSDFLRQHLDAGSSGLVSELHKRASGWHEANGTAHEAIGHALQREISTEPRS